MSKSEMRFACYFADLPDPRVDRIKWHRLNDILVITLCAVICGADSFEEIERFGDAREGRLRTFLALPNGTPSYDTFNRVLSALDRDRFSACFARWMTDLYEGTGLKVSPSTGRRVGRHRGTRSTGGRLASPGALTAFN